MSEVDNELADMMSRRVPRSQEPTNVMPTDSAIEHERGGLISITNGSNTEAIAKAHKGHYNVRYTH